MTVGAAASPSADLADRVAIAVLGVPGVVGLHPGVFGEVATYLPGRRVDGVRLRPDRSEVHLVLAWGAPALPTAEAVRAAASALTGTPVDVSVEDVADPAPHRLDQRG